MRALPALLLALALAATASAWHHEPCEPTTSEPEVTLATGLAGTFYVDQDCFDWCSLIGETTWWIYEESNGIGGLQRDDEWHDDTCGGQIRPDTLIF